MHQLIVRWSWGERGKTPESLSPSFFVHTVFFSLFKMSAAKKGQRYIGEEQYVLRVRDPELANRIRSTLREEGEAAKSKLEIIFQGTHDRYRAPY
jgi:hypothetical protein